MKNILILYTGGTIGMIENPATGALENFGLKRFFEYVPELTRLDCRIAAEALERPIDSSDMEPKHWVEIAQIVARNYDDYDGFVILHGTDTMAYTATALSFMFENLGKPVILTGSQLPVGKLRTDGKENLLTSIEIASAVNAEDKPMVPEVCIYFNGRLMRGNRTTKVNAEGFHAFRSFNYPSLAHVGINIRYNENVILRPENGAKFRLLPKLDNHVMLLTIFPGIRREYVEGLANIDGLKGVVLKTFGAGNAPQKVWLSTFIEKLQKKGVVVVNNTQCAEGSVEMFRYETGRILLQAGVVNGYDSTIECSIAKLMHLFGCGLNREEIIQKMNQSLRGEVDITE